MGYGKKKYIELHGEEAWRVELEKRKVKNAELRKIKKEQYHKMACEWRQNNQEKVKEAQKKYRNTHKEFLKNKWSEYSAEHKEELKIKGKQYREEHKEELKERRILWKKNNPEKSRATQIIQNCKKMDKKYNRGECTITPQWIIDKIFTSKCVYCGDDNWEHLGVDRIDNNLPHTPENCVCACGKCNVERGDRWTVEEFVEYKQLCLKAS
jgi:hypothetical protein